LIPDQVRKNLGKNCYIYKIKNDDIVHFFDQKISRSTPSRTFILKEGDEVWSRMKIEGESMQLQSNPKLECYMVNGSEIVSMLILMSNLEEIND
jgi:hypothetical protein